MLQQEKLKVAQVIEFYIPATFRRLRARWAFFANKSEVIQFVPGPRQKYVWLPNGALWPLGKPSFPVVHPQMEQQLALRK